MRRLIFIGLCLLVGTLVLSGCANQTNWREYFTVSSTQLAAVEKQPQPKMDVYVPLLDQFANSKHAVALATLNGNPGHKPSCYNCHSAQYRLAPVNAKPAIQQLNTSITCIVCHQLTPSGFSLKKSPLATCVQCHTAGSIVAGGEVNHPQKEMFEGEGAIGVPNEPSRKFQAGLSCVECHMPNDSHTFVALTPAEAMHQQVGDACMMCHTKLSPTEFAQQVTALQQRISSQSNKLQQQLKQCDAEISSAQKSGKDISAAEQLYKVAYTDVAFVVGDGSKGIHNINYAQNILNFAQSQLDKAEKLLGK
ncbi:MAG: ammonia-forming cytochrome c nitrite reductase subunit c552 [Peptococcaceae bacterium]|nr:ammonia-forming cytochrome c nitrite reductase subunit c552 [Peptococcaceae bacterium]